MSVGKPDKLKVVKIGLTPKENKILGDQAKEHGRSLRGEARHIVVESLTTESAIPLRELIREEVKEEMRDVKISIERLTEIVMENFH